MRKMKKFAAMLLALTMTCGMAMTASAAEKASIKINNVDANATVSAVQVIEADTETDTGWAFTERMAAKFKETEAFAGKDDQTIIWMLIGYAVPGTELPEGVAPASASAVDAALDKVTGHANVVDKDASATVCEFEVSAPGMYAIEAVDSTGEYTYSNMASYVGFAYGASGEADGVDVNVPVINAKRVDTKIEKTDNTDKVVEIGDVVEYTITTTIPYIEDKVETAVYTLTDTIEGAEYVVDEANKITVSIVYGETTTTKTADVTTNADAGTQTFTVDLSDIATIRENANETLTVKYSATVKKVVVNNSAYPTVGDHDYEPALDVVYTGSITMTKTNEENATLEGAQFVVYKLEGTAKSYALFETVDGKLTLNGFTADRNAAIEVEDENKVVTGSEGTVTVYGLDDSETYFFDEVVAPTGYSINETDEAAEWSTESPVENRVGTVSMVDTKLIALPSTGGIGTTIFTVAGCGIMIAAAYFFFAGNKKEEN